jgi:hypothetical protein
VGGGGERKGYYGVKRWKNAVYIPMKIAQGNPLNAVERVRRGRGEWDYNEGVNLFKVYSMHGLNYHNEISLMYNKSKIKNISTL